MSNTAVPLWLAAASCAERLGPLREAPEREQEAPLHRVHTVLLFSYTYPRTVSLLVGPASRAGLLHVPGPARLAGPTLGQEQRVRVSADAAGLVEGAVDGV